VGLLFRSPVVPLVTHSGPHSADRWVIAAGALWLLHFHILPLFSNFDPWFHAFFLKGFFLSFFCSLARVPSSSVPQVLVFYDLPHPHSSFGVSPFSPCESPCLPLGRVFVCFPSYHHIPVDTLLNYLRAISSFFYSSLFSFSAVEEDSLNFPPVPSSLATSSCNGFRASPSASQPWPFFP